MAYDHSLAARIRRVVIRRRGVTEMSMFGGLAFLLHGKMFCGILGDELMVRVGAAEHDGAVAEPHVRAMDFTGRPMRGYVLVSREGLGSDRGLARWVERGRSFVESSVLADEAGGRPGLRRRIAARAR
jgi:TfoX/Sxy family transcriptional regulator of competence genes